MTVQVEIRRPRRFMSQRSKEMRQRIGYGVLGVLIVIALWELVTTTGGVDPVFLSPPTEVWQTLVEMFQGRDVYQNLWVTFQEWALGFAMAVVVGILVGLAAGWSRWVGYVVQPWLNVLYAVPELGLIPIFIVWFGIGLQFKVWVSFLAAIFVVALNTISGVHSTDRRYLNVAETYGAGRLRTMRTVVLPGAVPYIMTGIRQASGRSLVGVIAAEFLSSNVGLGYFISFSGQTLNTSQVLAGVVLLGLFGIVIGLVFRGIEGRFDVWRR